MSTLLLIDEASFRTSAGANDDYLIIDAITLIMQSNLSHVFLSLRLTKFKAVIIKDIRRTTKNSFLLLLQNEFCTTTK